MQCSNMCLYREIYKCREGAKKILQTVCKTQRQAEKNVIAPNLVLKLDVILSFKVNNVCASALRQKKGDMYPKMDFKFEIRNEQTNEEEKRERRQHHITSAMNWAE